MLNTVMMYQSEMINLDRKVKMLHYDVTILSPGHNNLFIAAPPTAIG